MTAACTRRGFFLLSFGVILSRLLGSDSPAIVDFSEPRAAAEPAATSSGFEDASVMNLALDPSPAANSTVSGPAKSSSKVRRAIGEGFAYRSSVGEEAPAEQISPILLRAQTVPLAPEVVVMKRMEITDRVHRSERELSAAIANWRDPGPRNDSRFGTGLHQKDFGKVRASIVTVLYIPICFGFSW